MSQEQQKQPESFNFLETDPKKNFAPWFLGFCVALIIGGLAVAGYLKYEASRNYQDGAQNTDEENVDESDELAGLRTYRNKEYGFEFKHPQSWAVKSLMDPIDSNFMSESYDIVVGYTTPEQNAALGPTYCRSYSGQSARCETHEGFVIDWEYGGASINNAVGGTVGIYLKNSGAESRDIFREILSTFRFTETS